MIIRTLFSEKDKVCFLYSDQVRFGTVNGVSVRFRFREGFQEFLYSVDTQTEDSATTPFEVLEHALFEDNAANVAMLKPRILAAII